MEAAKISPWRHSVVSLTKRVTRVTHNTNITFVDRLNPVGSLGTLAKHLKMDLWGKMNNWDEEQTPMELFFGNLLILDQHKHQHKHQQHWWGNQTSGLASSQQSQEAPGESSRNSPWLSWLHKGESWSSYQERGVQARGWAPPPLPRSN